jgi:hypothetical protein
MLAFFGLSPSYKPILHTEIFNLVYYGKGGYTWDAVYDFPIWLRKFYIRLINETLQKQNKASKQNSTKPPVVQRPNIRPK